MSSSETAQSGVVRNSKKIAVVFEYLSSSFHLEASLDAAMRFSEQGFETRYIHVGPLVQYPEFRRNPFFGLLLPLVLKSGLSQLLFVRTNQAIKRARRVAKQKNLPVSFDFVKKNPASHLQVRSEVFPKASRSHHNPPAGVISSLVTRKRNSEVRSSRVSWMTRALCRAHTLGKQLGVWAREEGASRVLVFNGRFAFPSGVVESLSETDVQLWFHERGGSDGRGYFCQPFSPHSITEKSAMVRSRAAELTSDSKKLKASALAAWYFAKNRNGHQDADFSVTKLIPKPAHQGAAKSLVVYFSSSDDESVSLGRHAPRSFFENQRAAVSRLVELSEELDFNLIVRIHPIYAKKSRPEKKWWSARNPVFHSPRVTLIGPRKKVSSYDLMDFANVVISWRSLLGLEAVYWGKHSIVLAENAYSGGDVDLDFVDSDRALSRELRRVCMGIQRPVNPDSAISWGVFLGFSDTAFRHLMPEK